MRSSLAAAISVCAFAWTASAQRLSVGVVGGTNLTNHFPRADVSMPADPSGNPAFRSVIENGPRSFIWGASLEGRLSESFSIEGNVLRRPLKWRRTFTELLPDGTLRTVTGPLVAARTWEFPILLKYSLQPTQIAAARPFVTFGPSFRTREDITDTEPSQLGLTAGIGLTIPVGRFRVAPTFRYTRWRGENVAPRFETKADQVEFLTSVSYETNTEQRRFAGRRFEVGAVLGLPLTQGFEPLESNAVHDERFQYIAGFKAQVDVSPRLTLEANGLYKPLRVATRLPGGGPESRYSVLTWQFPFLVKYRFASGEWMPFVSGGPSLRLAGNLNGYRPSPIGVTAGAGIEKRVGAARWSGSVRYTRWAEDDRGLRTNPNAVELIVGLSF